MKKKSVWTTFWDMDSGGDQKEPYKFIFIEAPEEEAKIIFYNRFGHNPERITCTCCGPDYSIDEDESLEQATAFHRNCRFAYFKGGKEISQDEGWKSGVGNLPGVWSGYVEEPKLGYEDYQTMKEFRKRKDVLIIRKKEIKEEDKLGEVPEEGYIWVD